ncbi:MAG TPA: alpha-glucan family phosphorylase [Opitutaceae bacterium]
MNDLRSIAYFSMEIAVDPAMPTYAGGLGVLAGDTLRSCADLGVPVLAVTLLHRKGYLTQSFDASGWQREAETSWNVQDVLTEMTERVSVRIEGRTVQLRAWRYELTGLTGFKVPVYFLDSDLPENADWDRTLTHFLYGGDAYYRLCQEVILGIGGVRIVRALGHADIQRFHMNEGHASLLTLELLSEEARRGGRATISEADIAAVKARCIFTTHTPVEAGHDHYSMALVAQVFGRRDDFLDTCQAYGAELFRSVAQSDHGPPETSDIFSARNILNLTYLALSLSHYVNGVAKRHAEVARGLYATHTHRVDAITNGVHAASWAAPPFQKLFDQRIPGWRADNFSLRYAHGIGAGEIWAAHGEAKRQLLDHLRDHGYGTLDPEVLTLGFARRSTPYKRANLLLTDEARLVAIARNVGRLQIIYGGKAHPNDYGGKEIIQSILRRKAALRPGIEIVFVENYDLALAGLLVAGVDVWVNTPLPPLEASGTSGMKAALNGVPSLSILDGWWLEGCIEGATGWAIGEREAAGDPGQDRTARDAASFYDKLERVVAPMFYRDRERFIDVMRHTIALNGSFFNTQRMVQQYVVKAYFE